MLGICKIRRDVMQLAGIGSPRSGLKPLRAETARRETQDEQECNLQAAGRTEIKQRIFLLPGVDQSVWLLGRQG